MNERTRRRFTLQLTAAEWAAFDDFCDRMREGYGRRVSNAMAAMLLASTLDEPGKAWLRTGQRRWRERTREKGNRDLSAAPASEEHK